jgi:hypothetical protein
MDQRPHDPTAGRPPNDATEVVEAPPAIPPVPSTDMTSLPGTAAGALPGRSRVRWIVGGGIALVAILGVVFAATLLGARPLPEALTYVPADSAIVVELRPELPGDQRQKLGNFLAHFPGFDDQSILQTKIDEALGRIVQEATGGQVDYASQVKPLMAGPVMVAASADVLSSAGGAESEPHGFLVVATSEEGTTCDTVFKTTTAGSTHRDVEIRTVDEGDDIACATHGRFVLIGDLDGVKGGIDAKLDSSGIDTDETYKAAHGSLTGDQLGTSFVSGAALSAMVEDMTSMMGASLPEGSIPDWTIGGLRVEDDALVVDALAAPVTAPSAPSGAPTLAPASESRFATILPADTLAFLEVHGVGALAGRGLAELRADPDQAEMLEQLEAGLSILGGADNLTEWIEDVGIAVLPSGDGIGAVILIRGTDAEEAEEHLAQIRNLLVLASTGTDITVNDSDHNGVTITTVDLGDLNELLGGLSGLGGVPTPEVPDIDARVSFQMAVRDDIVLIAVGEALAEEILDVEAGSSLKSSPTYSRSMELVGATNNTQLYVAVDSTLMLLERLLPAEELESFMSEAKPYTDHLAGTSFSATVSGTSSRFRWVITVK